DANQHYNKKPCARERPTICPICYQDVITHFTRHLFRLHEKHKDVIKIRSLKPGSKERLSLLATLRKQGYFYLYVEKDVLNPVRTSNNSKSAYINVPTFMASMLSKNHEYLRTSRIKKEVFDIMRADDLSAVAKSDSLICLYGETLLAKHKRQQIAIVVSSRIREMARMLMTIKSMDSDVCGMFDAFRPDMFKILILAAKIVSGYDEDKKSFRAPSLALQKLLNICWDDRNEKKNEIKDLRKLIEAHWCNEISSLAIKTLKERQWEKPVQLPLSYLHFKHISGKEFHGKNLNDIELDQDIYYNSESSEDESEDNIESLLERVLRKRSKTDSEMVVNKKHTAKKVTNSLREGCEEEALTTEKTKKNNKEHTAKEVTDSSEEFEEILYKDWLNVESREEVLSKETTTDEDKELRLLKKQPNNKKVTGRIRWIGQETKIDLNYFRHHLKSKTTPKEHECDQFLAKYGERLVNKDW
ncbi:hypothetical protein ILUMI_19281, partial [Ignelater luminosus]